VQTKTPEIIWCKIGFAIIGFIAGSIWGFIFYPLINSIQPDLPAFPFYTTFVLVFVAASLINDKFVGQAGIGAIVAVYTYLGIGADSIPRQINWNDIHREIVTCLILGVIASTIALLFS
jgi:ABC-type lipoprotein release transport system permease subunit